MFEDVLNALLGDEDALLHVKGFCIQCEGVITDEDDFLFKGLGTMGTMKIQHIECPPSVEAGESRKVDDKFERYERRRYI